MVNIQILDTSIRMINTRNITKILLSNRLFQLQTHYVGTVPNSVTTLK